VATGFTTSGSYGSGGNSFAAEVFNASVALGSLTAGIRTRIASVINQTGVGGPLDNSNCTQQSGVVLSPRAGIIGTLLAYVCILCDRD
jgi:hypothetical protein